MGKHSLPESPGFWRSVFIAGFKYMVVAAVLAGLGFGIWKLVGNNNEPAAPDAAESLAPLPTDPDLDFSPVPEDTGAEGSAGGTGGTPSPGASVSPAASPTAAPGASPAASPGASPAAPGTGRVQILDGAGSGIRAAKAKQKIEGAGFQVAATGATSRPYEKTTVFYQPGNESLARDIAAVVGATDVLVAPANLDKSIPVAVVIGSDYPG
jgi:LytR cell envelope-related transcriptional attenuator